MRNKWLVLSLIALTLAAGGCAQQSSGGTTESAGERKPVSAEGSGKRRMVERDGQYYEVYDQHERLCSDCDR